MKIKVIGTGAIYTSYNSASTLVNDELIIDMPNGNHKQLLKMGQDIQKIRIHIYYSFTWRSFCRCSFFLKTPWNTRKKRKHFISSTKRNEKNTKTIMLRLWL